MVDISANVTENQGVKMERRLTAIVAADVVGYSRQMRVDEVGTLARKAGGPDRCDRRAAR